MNKREFKLLGSKDIVWCVFTKITDLSSPGLLGDESVVQQVRLRRVRRCVVDRVNSYDRAYDLPDSVIVRLANQGFASVHHRMLNGSTFRTAEEAQAQADKLNDRECQRLFKNQRKLNEAMNALSKKVFQHVHKLAK